MRNTEPTGDMRREDGVNTKNSNHAVPRHTRGALGSSGVFKWEVGKDKELEKGNMPCGSETLNDSKFGVLSTVPGSGNIKRRFKRYVEVLWQFRNLQVNLRRQQGQA